MVLRSRESNTAVLRPSNLGTAEFCSQKIQLNRRRRFFRVLVKHAYPTQTAYELRRLTRQRYAERTIYDWIAGRSEPPLAVYILVLSEILAD